MRVCDALLVEGTTKYSVLCYGVFPLSELDSAFDVLNSIPNLADSHIYKFQDHEWPNGLVLYEVLAAQEEDVPVVTIDALAKMMKIASCLGAACMYDGAFGAYADIFAPESADQTYAFCLSAGAPVLNFEPSILASKEWELIIASARRRIE
jgi:hypothetical protein